MALVPRPLPLDRDRRAFGPEGVAGGDGRVDGGDGGEAELPLLEGVRLVARGDGMIAPAVTRRLISAFAAKAAPRSDADLAAVAALTPREREVLAALGGGLSNAEIAAALSMAEATTKTHVSRILAKLELRSRVQAAMLAQDLGLSRGTE
ncbi:regulatory protein, luxR family [Actinacidiphila alni]|uniref:Regulatory protein, luxR family n=1 Tax=Actinacidiphila alni TaxID=380248 RepID=A0A1I2HXL0_9ACTN|nr:regulatory protein, luxR family [Actinacidiphila alni]